MYIKSKKIHEKFFRKNFLRFFAKNLRVFQTLLMFIFEKPDKGPYLEAQSQNRGSQMRTNTLH